MKILVVTLLYPLPENPARGVFVDDRVKLLRKLGHDVRVVNPLPRMLRINELRRSTLQGVAKAPRISEYEDHEIYHPRFTQLPENIFLKLTKMSVRNKVRKVEKWLGDWRPDVISCHTLWPIAEIAEKLANRWDIPWYATVHGFDFDIGLHTEISKSVINMAKRANKLVASSQRLADIANDKLNLNRKCDFIPCHTAVPHQWVQKLRTYRGHWRRGKLEILFPANPRRLEKRHMLALKACAELETRGWNVLMGGVSNVPRQLVFDRMLTCDLALITSSRESGPLVAREAISCGLPVVAVDVGDLSDWLPEYCIANDESPESIADAIEATIEEGPSHITIPNHFNEEAVGSAINHLLSNLQS